MTSFLLKDTKKYLYCDNTFALLGYLLSLTEYKAYHQIAKIMTFQMVYYLFLKSQGELIYKNSRTTVACNASCPIARLLSHNNTQGAHYW